MTYEPTIHIRDLSQFVNLTFNPYGIYFKTTGKKVSYFANQYDLSKFEIFQTILRNQSILTPIFYKRVLPDDLPLYFEWLFCVK